MKTIFSSRLKSSAVLFFSVLFLSTIFFNSCKDDDEDFGGTPYFNIEGDPTGLSLDINGGSTSYVVRSNRPWKIVAQSEGDWVQAFPAEGESDGRFKIIVDENPTFESRTMNFVFVVDGEEQPVMFLVEQEANVPFLTILEADDGVSIPASGGEVAVNIKANINWTYSLDNDNWLSEVELSETQIKLNAESNYGPQRSVTVTVTSPSYNGLTTEVKLTQSPGSVILEEDFSWLNYGNAVPYLYKEEKRYDLWTQEEKDMGWYVTPNEAAGGQQVCYARPGFVKLGKTNYGGDLISPKLNLQETKDVKVTFKAAVYISSGGNVDDNILKIFALGAGTPSVSEFIIDNIPNSKAEDEAGVVNDIWDPARAYSFTITGATSDTQIKFLGGDYELKGIGQGKNRIFLDDIKVEIIQE